MNLTKYFRGIGAHAMVGVAAAAIVVLGFDSSSLGAQALYWTAAAEDNLKFAIRRSDFDGSNVEDIVPGIVDSLAGLALDPEGEKIYWIERGIPENRIVRAGLDGEDPEPVHSTTDFLSRVALDLHGNQLYYVATGGSARAGIWRLGLLGGEPEQIVPEDVDDLAVDGAGGKIYWVREGALGEYGTNIWRAALDGSDPKAIIHHPFEHHTTGIALDVPGGKIYWSTVDYHATTQIVQRANLDGSDPQPVTTANPGLDDWPVFLGLDLPNRVVYWVNGEDGVFYRVGFDGGEGQRLFDDAGPYGPFGLVVLDQVKKPLQFRRGDVNGDGAVDLTDPVATLGALFLGAGPLHCKDAADANDDGALDLTDAIASLNYQFLGTFDIPAPGPLACGVDPAPADALDCEENAFCDSGPAIVR